MVFNGHFSQIVTLWTNVVLCPAEKDVKGIEKLKSVLVEV